MITIFIYTSIMTLFETSNDENAIEYFERWIEKLIRVYEPICLHLKTNLRFHVLFLFLFVVVIFESAASSTLCWKQEF